jgi:hypothetical protein
MQQHRINNPAKSGRDTGGEDVSACILSDYGLHCCRDNAAGLLFADKG